MRGLLLLFALGVVVGVSCVLPDDYVKVAASSSAGGELGGDGGAPAGGQGGVGGAGGSGAGPSAGGQGGSGGGTGGAGCAFVPTNDGFGGTMLDGAWTTSPLMSGVSFEVAGGELSVGLDNVAGNYGWFNADRGFFAYQLACGDFAAVVDVEVTDFAGTGAPSFDFNSGGLLVRNPAQPQSDDFWAMVAIGRHDGGTHRAETKATQHSVSVVAGHDLAGGPTLVGRVGLCRVGTQIRLSALAAGQPTWEVLATFDEFGSGAPDGEVSLPPLVELGIVANGWGGEDLRARFDDAQFWTPTSLADCTP